MEIWNWKTGNIIYHADVNSIKELVEKAVKEGVSLVGADLSYENLRDADLRGADLCGAKLRHAGLSGADLRGAKLAYADLRDADLNFADLGDVNLRGAYLNGVNLRDANLLYADIRDANFYCAHLTRARNVPDNFKMACPKDGSFVGWKKVKDKLVKLEIPEDAKRSSATTEKCRCSKAKVLEITDLDGVNQIDEVVNQNYKQNTVYRVGEMVYPDKFDDNRWIECSNGIHFFMDKQDAINYWY